jgi:hypothetical protein
LEREGREGRKRTVLNQDLLLKFDLKLFNVRIKLAVADLWWRGTDEPERLKKRGKWRRTSFNATSTSLSFTLRFFSMLTSTPEDLSSS